MQTVSKSFTAAGVSTSLLVRDKSSFTYDLSGTFSGTAVLEKSLDSGTSWNPVTAVLSAAASGTHLCENKSGGTALFRWRCVSRASGTLVTSMVDVAATLQTVTDRDGTVIFQIKEDGVGTLVRPSQKRVITGGARVGATSGFVVDGGTLNTGLLASVPASKTGSTAVIPLTGLKVGDTITGFHLIGCVGSVGGAVTVDAELRSMTDGTSITDASVGSMAQLAVSTATKISSANTALASLSAAVTADVTYYLLVTVTTAASTTVSLQGVAVTVTGS